MPPNAGTPHDFQRLQESTASSLGDFILAIWPSLQLQMTDPNSSPRSARLADSSYSSPYSRAGAPGPHPNTDPYAALRGRALATLEAMGFDPKTMVEHGVLWAEHQDPYGHVMHAQYMHFLGACFWRVMESYDEFLAKDECDAMIQAKTVVPVVRKYELDLRRQVKYPDAVSLARASARRRC